MDLEPNKRKRFLRRFLPALFLCAAGLFFFTSSAEAVQIKKIQKGDIFLDADDMSATAAIQKVNQNNTMILIFPNADVNTTNRLFNVLFTALFESDTTLVVSRDYASVAVTVTYYVIEFADGVNVQRGISSFIYGAYANPAYRIKDVILPTSVDPAKSFPIINVRCYLNSGVADEIAQVTGRIIDANTLQVQREASIDYNRVVNIVWQVVEFQTDAEVMSGVTYIPVNSASNTTTISPAIPSGEVNKCLLLYNSHVGNNTNGVEGYYRINGSIVNETAVRFYRGYSSATSLTHANVSWSVIHLNDSASLVQKNVTTLASGDPFTKVPVDTAFDAERALFTVGTTGATGTGNTYEDETMVTPGGEIFKGVAYDNYTNSVWVTGYATGDVYKFNATTGAYIGNYTVGERPVSVCFDYGNNHVWVANYGTSNVTRLYASNGTVIAHYGVGPNPIDIAYDPTSNSVWTANFGGPSTANAVTRIWTSNGTRANYTGYANRTMSICYDPGLAKMWAVYWVTDRISNFTCAAGAIANRDIGGTNQYYSRVRYAPTAGVAGLTRPTIWITSLRYHYVVRVNTTASTYTQFYPELAPDAVIWNPNSTSVWIANYAANSLNNMNVSTGDVTAVYNTSSNPYDMDYDPVNSRIWVVASNARELQAFNATTGTLEGVYTLPTEDSLYLARNNNGLAITADWQIAEFAPITLKTPNGGQIWRIGNTQKINWSYADSVDDHKVSLMITGGNTTNIANYIYPINVSSSLFAANNESGMGNGTYNWTIPASITNGSTMNLMNNSLRMAIIDDNLTVTGRNYDYSNAPFEIIGDINNIAPTGTGTIFYVGQTYPITWSKKGNFNFTSTGANTNFTIQLSTDGTDGNYTNITGLTNLKQEDCACSAVDDDCSYNWVVPLVFNGTTPLFGSTYKIRVYENSHSALVYNTSANNFTITGTINVTSPNGPENWTVGETNRYINWTKQGNYSTSNFSIALSTNGGSSYSDISGLTGLTQAACNCAADDDCSILWTPVPDNVSNTLKVRVYAAANPGINDTSNDNFTVKGSLTLTYPSAAGIAWNATENGTINWTKTGNWTGNRVNLTYSILEGATDAPIPDATDIDGNLGTFTWYNITPDAISDYVKIKITSNQSSDLQVSSESASYFAVKSLVTLTGPDSGTYNVSDMVNVTWRIYGDIPEGLHIGYNNGSGWVKLTSAAQVANQTGDGNGTWPWIVPEWATSETVKFRVATNESDDLGTPYDDSNNFIKLRGNITVNLPNETSSWRVGETNRTITWSTVGFKASDRLNISFSESGTFADEQILATNQIATLGSWLWSPIPNNTSVAPSSKVRIQWTTNSSVYDDSEDFSIKGTLNVVTPNGGGGQNFSINGTMPIQWNSTGTIGNVTLKYIAGGTNYTITAGQFPQNGSYNWSIPRDAEISEAVLVKVHSVADADGVNDTSNNYLAIRGAIQVTSPNTGSEKWAVGTNQTITWTRDGDKMGPVTLKYSTDGSNYTNVTDIPVNVTNGTNIYVWQIPDVMAANDSKYYNQTRVRVMYDNYTYDDSNNPFTIVPNFHLTYPGNGTVTYADDPLNITWTNDGKCSHVRIYFSANGGTNWELVHLGEDNISTAGYGGSYEWSVPNYTLGDNKMIAVNSAYDNTTGGLSTFNISAKIVVTAPTLNESLTVDSSYPIQWEFHGPSGPVNISFNNGTGGGFDTPIVNFTNGTSYDWPVPDRLGYLKKVRVSSVDYGYAYDDSPSFFIKGAIQLSTPNGAENYTVGGTMNITWNPHGDIGLLNITYDESNGTGNYTYLINNNTNALTGYYNWPIPGDFTPTTQGKIKVQTRSYNETYCPNCLDTSNATFTIKGTVSLLTPNPDVPASLTVGSMYNITWSNTGSIGHFNVWASYDNGTGWEKIADNVTNKYFNWNVTDDIKATPQLRIMVEDSTNPATNASSNNASAIKGIIRVIAPNGNESWAKGSNQSVQWRPTGTYPGNVKIYYSNDSGGNWSTAIGEAAAGEHNVTSTWYWDPIPDDIGSQTLIKVATDTGNSLMDVNDTSNDTFKIKGVITVLQPNGGEQWFVNETNRQIRWNAAGTVTPVKIEYSSGGSWNPVTDNFTGAAGINIYNWTPIPDENSESCLVRVSDNRTAFISEVTDVSNATFSVRPQIIISDPAANANVTAASTNTTAIRWNYTGTTIGDVNVDYSLNNGVNWTNIETNVNVESGSTYVWPDVPTVKSSEAKVRVYDVNNTNVVGNSSAFNIVGYLKLNSPDGGQNWAVGSTQYITWDSAAVTLVNVSYSENNGTDWTALGSISSSPFTWNISNTSTVTNIARIRIADEFNPNVTYSISNTTFAVRAAFDITQPEDGHNVTAEESYSINWTKKGAGVDSVILEYSLDSGGNWTNVTAGAVPNTGGYSWNPVPGEKLSNYGKIRITDPNNANATDIGAGLFYLRGGLSVTAPVNLDSWQIGDSTNITWTKKGNMSTVDILYSINNGTNWTQTLASGVSASALSWQWNISTDTNTTAQGRIKVQESANPDMVFGLSNGVFSIKGSLNLTAPTATGVVMTYDGGTSVYNVSWQRYGGIPLVELRYSTNGGNTYTDIIESNISGAGSPYSWNVPNAIGSNLKVKVSDQGDPSVNSTSVNPFAVKGAIQVLAPNGNESWLNGTNQSIQWRPTGTYPGNVKIYFSNDSGGNWTEIGEASAGEHNVTQTWYWDPVPDDITSTGLIRVATNTGNASIDVNDNSNNTFKVRGSVSVLQPNGGEIWFVNETNRQVRWSASGTVTPVKIEYSTGGSYIPITNNYTGTAGINTYNWTPVPDVQSETCLIRVSDNRTAFASEATDVSNATFAIRPQIFISEPAANANVTAASSNTTAIRWNYTGSTIGDVNVDYSTNNGVNWTNIATNVKVENGTTYVWPTVPTLKSSEAKVRVYDANNTNVVGNSSTFNIVGSLILTSPTGGQNWPVGSQQLISWSSAAVTQINVSYSFNNGTNWTYLGTSASSPYPWNISNSSQVSNNVLVRIADHENQNVTYSVSNATFAVVPVLNLVHPESGDNVTAEESYNITWTSKGLGADNVILEYTTTGQVGGNWTNVTNATVPNGAAGGYYIWNPVPGEKLSNYCKMRVTYADNINATDTGEDYFYLKGALSVTAPIGTETWQVGNTTNITWTKKGNMSTVNILYSTNGGANWNETLASGVNASSLSWQWDIPLDANTTTQGRIQVQEAANPDMVFAMSGGNFSIKGSINLTAPIAPGVVMDYDGGTSIYNISWQRYGGISLIELRYSTNGGTNYNNIIESNVSGSASPYAWTVPNAIGSNLKVKVSDQADASVNSSSANIFAIKGNIQVISPNGNESWINGTNQSIQWRPTGTYPGNVKIYFSNDSGGNWTEIGEASAGEHNTTQTWYWDPVPDDITASGLIRVSTNTGNTSIDVSDTSNVTFKIRGSINIMQPNGGEIWFVNETEHQIRWASIGTITPVKIEYTTGGSYIPITNSFTGTSGINTYNWTPIPDVESESCRVRVSDNRTGFSEVSDISNATFSIRPQIFISQPAAYDNVTAAANGTQAIRWNYTGSTIGDVGVSYSTNNGVDWIFIQAVKIDNGTNYFWPTVPTLVSSEAKVRVYDLNNTNVVGNSSTFNIVGSISLTSPTGGQNWAVGSQQLISWSSAAVSQVNVSYSLNNGTNWTALGSVTTSPYTWNISNSSQVSNNAKVRVYDETNPNNTYSISNNTFSIVPVFDITHPEAGDNVTAEEAYNITWTSKGAGIGDILLEYSTDYGSNWANVTTPIPNNNIYQWNPVPSGPLSNHSQIKITYLNNTNATDIGSDYFDLRGKVTVTSPDGDESWQIGEVRNITWTRKGLVPTVDIAYSPDNGGNWTTLATGANASSQLWAWNITSDTVTTTQAKIKVAVSSNPDIIFDTTNTTFEVKGRLDITAPNTTGIVLTYDGGLSSYNITWTKAGAISRVNLTYSTNNGTTYSNSIATNISAAASPHAWTVPNSIGSGLRIKVEDFDNPSVFGNSTANFAVKGSIQLISPNGNESWLVGTNQSIQWKPTGTYPGNVKIYYSNDSGGNWSEIGEASAGEHNTTQTWYWDPVPDDISSTGLIRVSTNTGNASVDVNDTSNNTFNIRGNVLVTQPNGAENWFVNDTNRQIKWTSIGTVTPVKIEYSTGAGYIPVTNSFVGISGANTYNWTPIPDNKSESCLVRVSDNRTAFTSVVTDTSNATFSILPQIFIQVPAANANVTANANSTEAIRWNYTGSTIDKVSIDYSTNGGVNWTNIQTNIDVENGTAYMWPTVPTLKTADARVRVTDIDMANVTALSSTFNIVGYLKLTSPDGNQNWEVGSTQYITWTSAAVTLVNVSYSLNNGTNWNILGSSATSPYTWNISNSSQVSNNVKVKVADQDNQNVSYSISNTTFAILPVLDVTHPEAGDNVTAEETYNITWTSKGTGADNVLLEYTPTGQVGGNWTDVVAGNVSNGASGGSYYWNPVPTGPLTNYYKVRITY
ncbi:MAG: hypothetical protein WC532_08645, partial [Candidatus Omnitrophota bacterium]